MGRYVFTYKGNGDTQQADLARIRNTPTLKVLDGDAGLLLTEVDDAHVDTLKTNLESWSVHPLTSIAKPDPKKKIRQRYQG